MYQLRGGCLSGSLAGCGPQPYGISLGQAASVQEQLDALFDRIDRQTALEIGFRNELDALKDKWGMASGWQRFKWNMMEPYQGAQDYKTAVELQHTIDILVEDIRLGMEAVIQIQLANPQEVAAIPQQYLNEWGQRLGDSLKAVTDVAIAQAHENKDRAMLWYETAHGLQGLAKALGLDNLDLSVKDFMQDVKDATGQTLLELGDKAQGILKWVAIGVAGLVVLKMVK